MRGPATRAACLLLAVSMALLAVPGGVYAVGTCRKCTPDCPQLCGLTPKPDAKKKDPCARIRRELARLNAALARVLKDEKDSADESKSEIASLESQIAQVDARLAQLQQQIQPTLDQIALDQATIKEYLRQVEDDRKDFGGQHKGLEEGTPGADLGLLAMAEAKRQEITKLQGQISGENAEMQGLLTQREDLEQDLSAEEKDYRSGIRGAADGDALSEAELRLKLSDAAKRLAACDKAAKAAPQGTK